MLSGILLILVTMLAVLGAYYLTELASQASAKRKTLKNAVVLLCAQDAEQMWAAVLDARAKLPDAALVVLSPKACSKSVRCNPTGRIHSNRYTDGKIGDQQKTTCKIWWRSILLYVG